MQRTKKTLVWTMLIALLVSLVPAGLLSTAEAAVLLKPTSYFTPDNANLRNTVDLLLTKPAQGSDKEQISRSNVLQVSDAELSVTGTYTKVTGSTVGATVQLLNWNQQTGRWEEDASRIAPGVVQLDVESPDNRFNARVTLYPGMNKITLSGSQGSMERSETFYALFDQVPYVEKLQVLGGAQKLDLNQGARLVVANKDVTLEGKAVNANKVTISINGGTDLSTTLLQDGTFFSPRMELNSGVNSLKLVAQNGSDSLTFQYSLYYYDETNPIVELHLADSSDVPQDLLARTEPVFTEDADNAKLFVQVMLADSGVPFNGNSTISLNNTPVTPLAYGNGLTVDEDGKILLTPGDEIIIPSSLSGEDAYRVVAFELPITFNKDNATPPAVLKSQRHTLSLTYGTRTVNKAVNFQYMKDQTVITDLRYLESYDETATTAPVAAGIPLNGAKVGSGEFYIRVKTNSAPSNPSALTAKYLPLSTSTLTPQLIRTISNTDYVFKISNFQNGNQTIRFQYTGSTAYKDVNISYASKNYIYVADVTDGQTYIIDSSADTSITINGQYIDFDLNSTFFLGEAFVNGVRVRSTDSSKNLTPAWLNKTTGQFSLSLVVDGETGPLVFGENRITFIGTGTDALGQTVEVRKDLRIYIVDQNVSTIRHFLPTAGGTGRLPFPSDDFAEDDALVTALFNLTPSFTFKDNQYVTSLQTYDLSFRGSGAVKLNLNMGTQNILSVDIPASLGSGREIVTYADKRYDVEFAGTQSDFVMRVRDLTNNAPGTYIYTLELINSTGAKTTQKVELLREVNAYRILAPQPSVGQDYVVNKNFVHFDIEAEGATQVLIGKEPAVKRTDLGPDRFVLDYVGLKQDRSNKIDIEIVRGSTSSKDSIDIFYTGTVGVDAQFMAVKVADKYSVFNKGLELTFPKGTVMQTTDTRNLTKFYPDTKLLFGIAEPTTGIVGRRDDYGSVIGFPQTYEDAGRPTFSIPDEFMYRFSDDYVYSNFGRISDVYWISGGMGELGSPSSAGYKPAINGIAPYSTEGLFGDPLIPAERKITPSKRGTLKLAYNPNVVDEVGSVVTVFRYDSTRQWKNVGGTVDTKSHTVTVPFDEFGYYVVMKLDRSYSDVTNHGWARNILNALYAKGFMNNLRFQQFGTDDQTTRGEFASILVKGLNLPLNYNSKNTFTDLVPGSASLTWDYAHIETAARAGIVNGLTDGVFGADQPVTREQAAVMIARALKLKLAANDSKLKDTLAKSFMDSGRIDNYALPSIQAVSKAGIMSGSPVTVTGQSKPSYNFNPKSNMTRSEAGKILVELLKQSTKVFPKTFS